MRIGDVVAVSGVGPILTGHTAPVLEVRPAAAGDASVLGVVFSRGEFYAASDSDTELDDDTVQPTSGDVAAGDYLFVATSGLAQVRVAPATTAITPGAGLTIAAAGGLVQAAGADAEPTLTFARAMESEADEQGLVWAMIE